MLKGKKGVRKYYKKRTTGKRLTAKKVAAIARRVTMKAAETKSYLQNSFLDPVDDLIGCQNLIYPISQGTGAGSIIGEKLYIKNIRIKGRLYSNTATNKNSKLCRIIVFRTKKQLTNTSTNSILSSDLFQNSVGGLAAKGHVDLHKVQLLVDKTFTIHMDLGDVTGTAGYRKQIPWEINVPVNRTEYFDQDNSGYLKSSNIYLAYTASDGSATLNPAVCEYSWAVNFKDE